MKKIAIALLIAVGAAFSAFAADPAPDFQDFARKQGAVYSYISPEMFSSMPALDSPVSDYGWFGPAMMSVESVMVAADSDLSASLLKAADKVIKRDGLVMMATKSNGSGSSYTIYGKRIGATNAMSDLLFIETISSSGQSYVKIVSLKGEINLRSLSM